MKENPLVHKNMTVAVVGLGVSGSAAVRYFHALGAEVSVSERRTRDQLRPEERQLVDDCCRHFEGGGHSLELLQQAELVFLSPGIPHTLPVLQKLERRSARIVGELALAAPVLSSRTIAVTGTNGKTTVTTLIGEILAAAGENVCVCGNIGRPLLDCLQSGKQPDSVVVEVSSFQLESGGEFRPDIAVLLNISPDHLDHHGSYADYIKAKAKIFKHQRSGDSAVICDDDILCAELGGNLENVEVFFFGHDKRCQAYICESEIYLRLRSSIERYDLSGTVLDTFTGRRNCAAALCAVRLAGVEGSVAEAAIRSFKGLPHRLELVDTVGGVRYYNDSKATNTGAVISALRQVPGRVILIAGGRDKGDDYGLLRQAVSAQVRHLIVIGEAAAAIASALEDIVPVSTAAGMDEAVRLADSAAAAGDSVLLSPACASFDMFEGYAHRGRVFKESVARIRTQTSPVES